MFFHPYTLWTRMQSVLNILEFDKVSDTPILSRCPYFLGLKLKLFYTLLGTRVITAKRKTLL